MDTIAELLDADDRGAVENLAGQPFGERVGEAGGPFDEPVRFRRLAGEIQLAKRPESAKALDAVTRQGDIRQAQQADRRVRCTSLAKDLLEGQPVIGCLEFLRRPAVRGGIAEE